MNLKSLFHVKGATNNKNVMAEGFFPPPHLFIYCTWSSLRVFL